MKRALLSLLLASVGLSVCDCQLAHAQAELEVSADQPGVANADGGAGPLKLELQSESLDVVLDHQYATMRMTQIFDNRLPNRVEGRYSLRAGAGAQVQKLAYWNGEQKIVGEVFEKQTAEAVYNETSGQGRDPAILERSGEGAFRFRIFPIEAGEKKKIAIELGQWLTRSGNTVELRSPIGRADSRITVELREDRKLTNLRSATHELMVEDLGRGRLRIRATPKADAAGQNFWLAYDLVEAPWQMAAAVHKDAGQDAYVMVHMTAPSQSKAIATHKDVTIVLDHSGSMNGEPLAQAKLAAEAVVERLNEGDRVNVIAFDDSVDRLFSKPLPLDAKSRVQALDYIRSIACGGGTNIALALRLALTSQMDDDSRAKIVLFLTDGQSAAPPIFEAARGDKSNARVFTVGLGSGVDKPLLSRLAKDKRGRFVYVESAAAIRPQVEGLFRALEQPVFLDVQVAAEGGGQLMRVYPKSIPDLNPGEELVLTARVRNPQPGMIVNIEGRVGGKPVKYALPIDASKESARPWVGRLWAASRVDDLLEEIALGGESGELKDETIDLALSYDLVTPYTAFLAVPESELSAANKTVLATARARKQTLLANHADAVALSRSAMPPGDPVLTVRAPADARSVTARFPFGLVKDLAYDEVTHAWKTRFLVPKSVTDGDYTANVKVVHADGSVELLAAHFTIDSAEPDFDVEVDATGQGVSINVIGPDDLREVTVALVSNPQVRMHLTALGAGKFAGKLALPVGAHELRIVVADVARNEADRVIPCVVGNGTGTGPAISLAKEAK